MKLTVQSKHVQNLQLRKFRPISCKEGHIYFWMKILQSLPCFFDPVLKVTSTNDFYQLQREENMAEEVGNHIHTDPSMSQYHYVFRLLFTLESSKPHLVVIREASWFLNQVVSLLSKKTKRNIVPL